MLEVGTKAPEFELPDQNGIMHTLSEYKGKKVILYFYPKDSTPGCTRQASGYSERYHLFLEKGVTVIGISKDSGRNIGLFQGTTRKLITNKKELAAALA